MKILYVDASGGDQWLEDWGVHLVNVMSAQLRDALGSQFLLDQIINEEAFPFEGPEFVYDVAPKLFLGRKGRGPLFLAWDTNLLIDYFQFGAELWQGSLPDSIDAEYQAELQGLQLLLSLWVMRDIRMVMLPGSINDAKKILSNTRRLERVNAFTEFANALSLVNYSSPEIDVPSRDGLLVLPDSLLEDTLKNAPNGNDRDLIRSAIRRGAHAFITRDEGILRGKRAFTSFGLLIASPLDLLEELVGCGAYHCLIDPRRYAYWPLPDLQRVAHLIRALPSFDPAVEQIKPRGVRLR